MDRQDPGITSLEDEAGKELEDSQRYLTEMMRELFGRGDLDGDANFAPRSGSEGIGQTSAMPSVPTKQEKHVGGLKWDVTRIALERAISRIRRRTATGTDGIPAALIKQLVKGPESTLRVFSSLT